MNVDPTSFIALSYGLAAVLLGGSFALLQRQQKRLQRIYATIREK
jgi:hypothetical protein